jgi:hypothetical protein
MLFIVLLFLVVLVFFPQREPSGPDDFMAWAFRPWREHDEG